MGLRLFDERRQVWNDCSHRVAEAEIMKTDHDRPSGAPAWVHDPEELWNRVEACEQRKDSQVCRDVVVPLSAILTDVKATNSALWFAHYIAEQLQTPVSMALHRNPEPCAFTIYEYRQKATVFREVYWSNKTHFGTIRP